jgi:hypothetical protein
LPKRKIIVQKIFFACFARRYIIQIKFLNNNSTNMNLEKYMISGKPGLYVLKVQTLRVCCQNH